MGVHHHCLAVSRHLRPLRFKVWSTSQLPNHLRAWKEGKGNLDFDSRPRSECRGFIAFYLFMYCVCMYVWVCPRHDTHMEIRGSQFSPSTLSQELNSGHKPDGNYLPLLAHLTSSEYIFLNSKLSSLTHGPCVH